jgi:hypothetical protein
VNNGGLEAENPEQLISFWSARKENAAILDRVIVEYDGGILRPRKHASAHLLNQSLLPSQTTLGRHFHRMPEAHLEVVCHRDIGVMD